MLALWVIQILQLKLSVYSNKKIMGIKANYCKIKLLFFLLSNTTNLILVKTRIFVKVSIRNNSQPKISKIFRFLMQKTWILYNKVY